MSHKNPTIQGCTRTVARLDPAPPAKKQNDKATPKSAPRSSHKNCAGMCHSQHHHTSNSKKQCPQVVAQELPPPHPQHNPTQDMQGSGGTPKNKKTLKMTPKTSPRSPQEGRITSLGRLRLVIRPSWRVVVAKITLRSPQDTP